MFIDSHCHLDRLDLSLHDNNLDNVIQSAAAQKVNKLLCVSVTLADFPKMAEQTAKYDNVYLTCGAHPLNQDDEIIPEQLFSLSQHERVIAIGETGLDYHYAPETKALQLDSFKKHIHVAKKLKKPLIIHTREAQQDTLSILRNEGANEVGGILHCFTESWEMAEEAIELGFYISFSGIVTFKNATALREVAALVPNEKLLIETDAPYLAPSPFRGKRNESAYIPYIAKKLSDIHGISEEEVGRITTQNALTVFNIKA